MNMKYMKALLKFKYTQDIMENLNSIVNWIIYSPDDIHETGSDDLIKKIEEKVLEIDMLLSRIQHAADYNNWIEIDRDIALDEIEESVEVEQGVTGINI